MSLGYVPAGHKGDAVRHDDIRRDVLKRCIFGIDVNSMTVDLAKLSLWLATAKKGRNLISLKRNLVCGDSLIDDVETSPSAIKLQAVFPFLKKRRRRGSIFLFYRPPPFLLKGQKEKIPEDT
jgi:hypothetical protein